MMPGGRFWRGLGRVADPKITLASAASMFLGACAAAHVGPLSWPWLGATVLGVFFLEAAKNASGELFDFDSGVDAGVAPEDRSPFSGGKRVLVDGLLSRGETIAVAAVFYSLGTAVGLAIALAREPDILVLGAVGVVLAFGYHAPPLRLSYRGLGEIAVAVCYGPLIAAGTALVQRGTVTPAAVASFVPLGVMIAAFLWINEFPDYRADRAAGKRTLVVRMGRRSASRAFAGLVAVAFGVLAVLPALGSPRAIWLGAAGLPCGLAAARRLWVDFDHTARIVPAQAWTLGAFALLALGTGIGWWIG